MRPQGQCVALLDPRPADVARLVELKVDQLIVVAGPPDDPRTVEGWVTSLFAPLKDWAGDDWGYLAPMR